LKPVLLFVPSRFLTLVALAGLSLSSPAQQLGHYIGGFTGLDNGSSAPPGFYAAAFGLVEPVNSIKGPSGNTVLRPDIDVGGVIAAYSVVTPKKILGGDYTLAFMVPVLNTRSAPISLMPPLNPPVSPTSCSNLSAWVGRRARRTIQQATRSMLRAVTSILTRLLILASVFGST
jgi:hypothetical protein